MKPGFDLGSLALELQALNQHTMLQNLYELPISPLNHSSFLLVFKYAMLLLLKTKYWRLGFKSPHKDFNGLELDFVANAHSCR